MIDINFNILFTVELCHNFYANQVCPDFLITPSDETLNVLNGHGIIWRNYGNQLVAGIQCPPGTQSPLTGLESTMKLTFFLQCTNPQFLNYTDLPITGNKSLYYFTNRNFTNSNGSKFFLSKNIAAYSASTSYSPGDLVTSAGTTYEAIQFSSSPGNPSGVSNTQYWIPIDNNSYVTANDQVTWLPSVSNYLFTSPQNSATIIVYGYNTATNDYSLPVLSPPVISFPNPASSFSLNLSSLPSGKYKLNVNGVNQWIYLNNELAGANIFGVIDIYNDTNLPVGYQLITPANNLPASPVFYSIYFLNRYTKWAYILKGSVGSITDTAGIYQFLPINATNTIYSSTPIPLKETSFQFQLTKSGNTFPVPCATPGSLAQTPDNFYCSQIYLNY